MNIILPKSLTLYSRALLRVSEVQSIYYIMSLFQCNRSLDIWEKTKLRNKSSELHLFLGELHLHYNSCAVITKISPTKIVFHPLFFPDQSLELVQIANSNSYSGLKTTWHHSKELCSWNIKASKLCNSHWIIELWIILGALKCSIIK